jgi:signal transduction histidine kinase
MGRKTAEGADGAAPRAGRPLTWHLGLLCTALLLPMLALTALMLFGTAAAQRANHEDVARDAARRIAVSLDRGLATLGAVAEVLATSDHLIVDDLAAFRTRIEHLPRVRDANIVLRSLDGELLMSSDAAQPGDRDLQAEAAAHQTGRPQFSGLLPTRGISGPTFSVAVPVPPQAGGAVRLLTLYIPVAEVQTLLANDGVPAGMTVSITDRNGTILARSRDAERLVGTHAPRGLPPNEVAGWQYSVDADGEPTVLAFARSEMAGWAAWVFMPESAFVAPLHRSLALTILVALSFGGLAAVLALLFARRLTQPISALAMAVARGETSMAMTPVQEVNALAGAYAAERAEAQRLRDAQNELRQMVRLNEMSTLAAALAHEINQPLTAAATYSEAALRMLDRPQGLPPDLLAACDAMREVVGQVMHAGRVVRRLRNFLSSSDGQRVPTDLNHLVAEAVALALADARQRGIQPSLELEADMPDVELDQIQIMQVLVNLVRNAVEATSGEPDAEVVISTRSVTGGRVQIAVADTGHGVPEEVQARLFSPFVTTKAGGMGVGLAISRGIVEEHEGRLEWAPRPGGGTLFRVLLPIRPVANAPVEVASRDV